PSRRVLRAASVYGQAFWQGSVAALLGGAERTLQLHDWLTELADREIIIKRTESRFPGEREFVFRHALVRDGAYAMLTDADKALGHRLAGEWLSRAGESDAVALAEHFERGAEPNRAVECYCRAAEHA